jgi:epsilon-lactone hydrolase
VTPPHAGGRDLADPEVSPLFADLTRPPPTLVQVGGRDILLADAERLAGRAADHGRRVDLRVWPDMWHVWHSAAPLLPEANAAIRDAGAWLRRHR